MSLQMLHAQFNAKRSELNRFNAYLSHCQAVRLIDEIGVALNDLHWRFPSRQELSLEELNQETILTKKKTFEQVEIYFQALQQISLENLQELEQILKEGKIQVWFEQRKKLLFELNDLEDKIREEEAILTSKVSELLKSVEDGSLALGNDIKIAGIYLIWDRDGNLLYVGQSESIENRLAYRPCFHGNIVRTIKCEDYCTRLALERTLIEKLRPMTNVIHNR